MKQLSKTQRTILAAAIKEPKAPIEKHMAFLKSPAVRRQVAYSMLCSGYVSEDGEQHFLTDEGIAAAGGKAAKQKKPAAAKAEKSKKPAAPKAKAAASEDGKPAQGRQLLIDMMSSDDGATTEQMIKATGWQRGAIGGTLSKIKKVLEPLKQEITSTKGEDGKLIYKIKAA